MSVVITGSMITVELGTELLKVSIGRDTVIVIGVEVGAAVGVAVVVAVGDAVAVAVGVGVGHPVKVFTSTVLVSAVPLYPPTITRRLPIAAPPVKECATFVLGPDDQLSPAML